jgi:hypothetical protein
MRYKTVIAEMLASLSFIWVVPTFGQSQAIHLNGGIQAQLVSVGRDKTFHYLTVSMTLANTGKNTIYLLLLPGVPSTGPKAQDNAGSTFVYRSASGIAICPSYDTTWCIGVPTVIQGGTPPLQSWMELDPNTSPVTLNFQLSTNQDSQGPLASFSCTFASRVVSDPRREDTLTEKQKRDRIHLMNLSFPPTPVTQEQ